MKYWQLKILKSFEILLSLLVIFVEYGFGQTVPAPKFETPNTATLGKYGDIPVSYFTGVPNISFPLYRISVGNINVPISLTYHPGSVKPNEHTGWVGLGWNLNAYGKITRTEGLFIDEGNNGTPNLYPFYPDNVYHPGGDGATFMNTTDWNTPTRLGNVFNTQQTTPQSWYDAVADEFSFVFGNYSGTFYFTANGWQVVSENPNLKVQELGFMDYNEISNAQVNYNPSFGGGLTSAIQSRMFRGFMITTDDGTKYTFGSVIANDPNSGIEFKADYAGSYTGLTANTWLLRKIEDADGQVVTFDYQKKERTCAMSYYTTQTDYSCYYDWSGFSGWQAGPINTALHSGVLLYPVYLKKITSSKEIIDFNISATSELRYQDSYLRYAAYDQGGPAGLVEFSLGAIGNDVNNLKWYQLDNIVIRSKFNSDIKKIKFNFSTQTSQRLALSSFSEQDIFGNDVKKYTFSYYNISGLPPYGGDQTDHWGYYNATPLNGKSFANLNILKGTNPSAVGTGLLQTVVYPTGGKTDYVWEANTASRVVSSGRQSLQEFAQPYVGGCRIKEIKNYSDPLGNNPLTTKYFYGKNFSVGIDPESLVSSGVLNGTPKYDFNIPSRVGIFNASTLSYHLESVNGLTSYSYNGASSHVGYTEVVEQKPDNSYTKYFFTNYDIDINGNAHWDEQPGVIGWQLGGSEDKYVKMSSLELERGKPILTLVYRSDNVLLQKTNLFYRNDAGRFTDFIKLYDLRNSLACNTYDALILASAYKAFKYQYYVVKEVKTEYNINGANPITTTKDFEYNITNQLSKLTNTASNGRKLITRYKYPLDFDITAGSSPEVLALKTMKARNIISLPVEIQTIQEVDGIQTLLNGKIIKYKDVGNGILKPFEELGTELQAASGNITQCSINASNQFVYHPSYKSKLLYDSYELNGNIKQLHQANNISKSYLWGYNLTGIGV